MKPSIKAAAKELTKRLKKEAKPLSLDPLFTKQNAFINDTSRYLVAQCSRRAGKTNGLAIRFFKTMESHPKSQCIYLGLTLDSARDIMWPVLQELNDAFQLGCTFVESRLTMTHPNGAKLRLFGADMSNFIKRLKGRKYPGVAIDEAQDFGQHLKSLVDDVLTPSIADYQDGWLALTGTPGPVPKGYFYEITQEKRFGYSFHEWTLLENPYMPDPSGFIEDLKKKREWTSDNPTLLREWLNKWVLDVESLWIRYKEKLNHFEQLPTITPSKYNYIVGVDLGFRDSDAIAVLAWSSALPDTFLVEEVITPKQGITDLANQIKTIIQKYDPDKIVVDYGGLGKKIIEELRRQHQLPVVEADKKLKQQNVEFLNDHLRLGRFKAKSASRFAQDSYQVQIDWEKSTSDKIVVKKQPHSDIIDAVLYAFKESPAYSYEKPPEAPKVGSREWAEQQQSGMWETAQQHFQEEAERRKNIEGQWD